MSSGSGRHGGDDDLVLVICVGTAESLVGWSRTCMFEKASYRNSTGTRALDTQLDICTGRWERTYIYQGLLLPHERLFSCSTGQITVHAQFFSVVTWSYWMPRRRFLTGSAEGKAGACRDTVNSCNACLCTPFLYSVQCSRSRKKRNEGVQQRRITALARDLVVVTRHERAS